MTDMILILNGPNLNMLGMREPSIYGSETYDDVMAICRTACETGKYKADIRQSNHEGELVAWVQDASQNTDVKGVVINAGAYTHTSLALHDALRLLTCPIFEVHISNPSEREEFRHFSYIESLATESICGLGVDGYRIAIENLINTLNN